ncbi:MAG: translocation/assembly module TamB domain-containing protein [Prevotella sp.]|nr:translocation/assembly module TamB domain-containing protein [Prevotella sp.]
MKKIKHFISWTIWSLLALYVLIVVLIQLPFVQNWLGQLVAGAISKKLNTEVTIGRVDLGFLNRVTVDDVVIHDQRSLEMVQARRMSVRIDLLPLLDGRIEISSAQLFGVEARLYRDSANAEPNYQFAIDALSSKEEKDEPMKLDLRLGSLIVRRMAISYDQLDAPSTPGRFNPQHIKISDVSTHALLHHLTPDTLSLDIKRLSLKEQSGLELRELALKLEAGPNNASLTNFAFATPNSSLSIDTLAAYYQKDDIPSTLKLSVNQLHSNILLDDFSSLLPSQIPREYTFSIDASGSGTQKGFDLRHLNISSPDHLIQMTADGSYRNDHYHANIENLFVSNRLLDELHMILPIVPQFITNLGDVSLTAQVSQHQDDETAVIGKINTSIGMLTYQGKMASSLKQWDAVVHTDSLDLQQLFSNPSLGTISADLDLQAINQTVNVKAKIPQVDWKNYSYNNLFVEGTYFSDNFRGKLSIDDPNAKVDVEGSVANILSLPHIRVTGDISHFAPQALHLSDRWDDAVFSAIIDADVAATSLVDAEGTIDLDDFILAQNDTAHYHLDNLHIKSGFTEGNHYLNLYSDFGEGMISGRYHWNTLANSVFSSVPMLFPDRPLSDNDFTLHLELTNSQWLQKLLGIPLDLDGPLHLDAQVVDSIHQIDVNAKIPSFSYASGNYKNASLQMNTKGDSTHLDLQASQLTAKGNMMNMQLTADSRDDQLYSAITINSDQSGGGTINTITRHYKNDDGIRETHVRVMPSQLIMKGMVWDLEPCDILYSEKRLMIDQFTLHHDNEHIIVDGIASTNENDSLILDINGVDIASILDIVNFRSVRFGGKVTGNAYVCHAFKNAEAWADITVNDFLFQEAHMGALEAHALWNNEEGQIDIDAAIDDGAEEQTYIDGFISPRQKSIDLGIRARGTSLGFIQSFTKSFISEISGNVFGDVRIFGPLKKIDLSGDAVVKGLASIKPLGTTYTFQDDTVRLSSGTIAFNDFHVYDRDHNLALLNGTINHTNFKNFGFSLHANADNLLAYDFPSLEAGSTIGGSVTVNGNASLQGKPGEVVIDCDVTPTPSSYFIYNAANPDAINRQQFITWTNSSLTKETKDTTVPSTNQPVRQSGDLRLNLRINATPDATLRLLMDQHSGDYITLNGNGVLRASYYNKGPFQMFGTYNVERGTYSMTIQNIIKKNFTFQPGSTLVFGGDPLQASLSLKALHTVNGVSLSDLGLGNSFTSNTIRVNCLMNILGTAGDPHVEFDLEMPTVNSEEQQMIRSIISSEQEMNQQVVYLLGIGRFYTQGANNATTQTYGQTELAMQSLLSGTVSSQINQLLSQVIRNDDWNFGANISTGNEGWHNAEYEGLISGRMLNNRLLINGQFGYRDNATQATPSFIGDFDISYLLTPGGSLALKAYNQTNDRYFTHSSLNTQGIGIIMKKDFNGLRDLFSHRKKKEK